MNKKFLGSILTGLIVISPSISAHYSRGSSSISNSINNESFYSEHFKTKLNSIKSLLNEDECKNLEIYLSSYIDKFTAPELLDSLSFEMLSKWINLNIPKDKNVEKNVNIYAILMNKSYQEMYNFMANDTNTNTSSMNKFSQETDNFITKDTAKNWSLFDSIANFNDIDFCFNDNDEIEFDFGFDF